MVSYELFYMSYEKGLTLPKSRLISVGNLAIKLYHGEYLRQFIFGNLTIYLLRTVCC